ncbi:hypothetical protein [Ammoniphilus sp. YIM 78166]|uniref:hypothetical protein n=1 Tax=Ammoniphilus sp. YIM 78166 TaxID=1644106 RepID=UPI00107047D4|nr:hypothetical protein [Ammoniphilus sp. YIM 78166]
MDKNRARITIKLTPSAKEGQAPKEKEKEKVVSVEPSQETPIDIKVPEEAEKLTEPSVEEIKPRVEPEPEPEPEPFIARKEVAVGKETEGDEPSTPEWRFPRTNRRSYKSRTRSSREDQAKRMVGVAASVIGAVALGLIFGFVVLGFFKSGLLDKSSTPAANIANPQNMASAPSQVQGGPDAVSPAEATTPPEGQAEGSTVSITLPSQNMFVVQGGVFQDQKSASPMLDRIKAKGWPSSLVGDKPIHLFLGMAAVRDHALAMAAPYKEMDVYIKEWGEESRTVTVALKPGASTNQEEWDQWFQFEATMVQAMGSAITEGLTTGKLSGETMKKVTDAHRNMLQQGRLVVSKLPQEQQSLGNRLLNDISKGVSALERYQKQPTEGYAWQAQQALMDAYTSKSQLFSSFK